MEARLNTKKTKLKVEAGNEVKICVRGTICRLTSSEHGIVALCCKSCELLESTCSVKGCDHVNDEPCMFEGT